MSKVKTRKVFKSIYLVSAVCLGIASLFTFIDGGRTIFGTISAGLFFAVLALANLKMFESVSKQLNATSK